MQILPPPWFRAGLAAGVLCAGLWQAAPGRAAGLDAIGRALGAIRASGFTSFAFMPVDRDGEALAWVWWSEGVAGGGSSTVALVRLRGSSVAPLWRRRYEGAYEPALVQLYGALEESRTRFLLRFQRGADDANGVLIAVDERDVVSVVGEVEGQTVDLLPWDGNTIRVTTSPADPTICYRSVGRALSSHPCPAR